jgi:2-dehydro-3-deoxygluconokinase
MAVLYPQEPIALDQASTLTIDIAGAESNLAIGLSRLGHRVQFMSRVGHDPFGQRIRATLTAEGVDTTYLLTDAAAPTGVVFRECCRMEVAVSSITAAVQPPAALRQRMCNPKRLQAHASSI